VGRRFAGLEKRMADSRKRSGISSSNIARGESWALRAARGVACVATEKELSPEPQRRGRASGVFG
jgi:hypothetical protein